MPERHFEEYQLFYNEQPFGLWREDYRTAQISHLLALINRDPKSKAPDLTEFMPFYKESKAEEVEDDGSATFLANR
ncbi:phage tail assembly protein T [Pasteurella sp. P03HT]